MKAVRLICPDCKEDPPNLQEEYSSGDIVCTSCGLVIGDRIIDTRNEWRSFSNDDSRGDDPSRVGEAADPLLKGAQLDTMIAVPHGVRNPLATVQRRVKEHSDRDQQQLVAAYTEIGHYCDRLGLNAVIADHAKHLFRIASDSKLIKTRPRDAIIASCLVIACKQTGAARSFKEICSLMHVDIKPVARLYREVKELLAKRDETADFAMAPATTAADLLVRLGNRLRLDQNMRDTCRKVVERVENAGFLAGRNPFTTAAASIYVSTFLIGKALELRNIASAAELSEGTIRNAFRQICDHRELFNDMGSEKLP